ncbi:hypothetical protein ACFCP7_17620 [Paenibacillus elgii]
MSWDVLIMKEKYDFDSPEENQPDIAPLGKRDEIIEKLTQCIPNLDYRDEAWGILNDEGFSIEFNTGDEEIVDSIMLYIRGGGTVMDTLQLVCETLDAYALDTSNNTYIDFKQPDQAQETRQSNSYPGRIA